MLNKVIEEYQYENFLLSSNPDKLDFRVIHKYLSENSYWAQNIPMNIVKRSVENSVCFGLYDMEKQIGLTRVITDKATFAYLADIFVLDEYRGKDLGTWMIEKVMKSSELHGLKRWQLSTRNAHSFYEKFGFHALEYPDRHMTIKYNNIYGKSKEK